MRKFFSYWSQKMSFTAGLMFLLITIFGAAGMMLYARADWGGTANMYPATEYVDDRGGATNVTWVMDATVTTTLSANSLYHFIFPSFSGMDFGLSGATLVSSTLPLVTDLGTTTNTIMDASFETPVTGGWYFMTEMGGSGEFRSDAWHGSSSAWFAAGAEYGQPGVFLSDIDAVVGQTATYTLSFYAKGAAEGDVLTTVLMWSGNSASCGDSLMKFYNFTSSTWSDCISNMDAFTEPAYSTTTVLTTSYTRYTQSFITDAAMLHVRLIFAVMSPSDAVYIDAVQLESGSVPTDFQLLQYQNPTVGLGYNANVPNGLYGYITSSISADTNLSFTFSGITNPNVSEQVSGSFTLEQYGYPHMCGLYPWLNDCNTGGRDFLAGNQITLYANSLEYGNVDGIVTSSEDSAPIAGVTVYLYENNNRYSATTTTDIDGYYYFNNVPTISGDYAYRIRASKSGLGTIITNDLFSVTADTTTTKNFTMGPGGGLAGVVTDAGTALPLVGANISIYPLLGGTSRYAVTDDSGQYSITDLPVGSYNMQSFNISGYYSSSTVVLVEAGSTTTADLAVLPLRYAGLYGMVTSSVDGSPISNVRVDLFGTYASSTLTNFNGEYFFYNFPAELPGNSNSLQFSNQWYLVGNTTRELVPNTTTTVNATLSPAGSIKFVVTDTNTGNPVSNVMISLRLPDYSVSQGGTTNASGEWEIGGLVVSSTYMVEAQVIGQSPMTPLTDQVVVAGVTSTISFSLDSGVVPESPAVYFTLNPNQVGDDLAGATSANWVFNVTTTAQLLDGDAIAFVFPTSSEFSSQFDLSAAAQEFVEGSLALYKNFATESANHYTNADFESWSNTTTPVDWSVGGFVGQEIVDGVYNATTTAYSDGQALETINGASAEGIFFNNNQYTISTDTQAYIGSIYAKSIGGAGQAHLLVIAGDRDMDPQVWNFTSSTWESVDMGRLEDYFNSFSLPSNSWERISYTIPSNNLDALGRFPMFMWINRLPNQDIIFDAAQMEHSQNLLNNADFDALSSSTWAFYGQNGGGINDGVVEYVTDYYSGTNGGHSSIKLTTAATDNSVIMGQEISVSTNTAYTASIWAQRVGSETVNTVFLVIADGNCWDFGNATWTPMGMGPGSECMQANNLTTGDWTQFSATITTTPDNDITGATFLWGVSAAGAGVSAIFDSAQVVSGHSVVAPGPTTFVTTTLAATGLNVGTGDSANLVYGYVATTVPANTHFVMGINGVTNADAAVSTTLQNLRWHVNAGTPASQGSWGGFSNQKMSVSTTASLVVAEGPMTAPVAPSAPTSAALSTSSLLFSWTDNSNNEDGFTYEGSFDCETYVHINETSANATSTILSSLSPNSFNLCLRVAAYNAAGTSTYTTTTGAYTLAAVPNTPVVSNVATTTVDLTWDTNSNSPGDTVYYVFGSNGFTATTTLNIMTVTGLTGGTEYQFQVRAENAGAPGTYSAYSASSTATTTLGEAGTVSISGTITFFTSSTLPVRTATVTLYDDLGNLLSTTTTDSNGYYFFNGLASHNNYVVSTTKNDLKRGVSITDVTLAARRVANLVSFATDTYKMMAADANWSGTVNITDVAKISRLVANLDTVMTAGSWKFFPSDVASTLTTSTYRTASNTKSLNDLSAPITVDFWGVKMGDVNGSWTNG